MSFEVPVTCFGVATESSFRNGAEPAEGLPQSAPVAEYGGELLLEGATEWLTGFTFEYFANYDQPGGLVFRLHRQDGVGEIPGESDGDPVYEQVMDVRNGGARVTACFNESEALGFPSRMTYSVCFLDLKPGQMAGLVARRSEPDVPEEDGEWRGQLDGIAPDEAALLCQWQVFQCVEPRTVGLLVTPAGLLFAGFECRS